MKLCGFAALLMASAAGAQAFFQISDISVSTTATQAILQYASPVSQACSLKAADMNRSIVVTGGSQGAGVVTITTRSPHGLSGGAMVYFEGTGVAGWNGWQTVSAVADTTHFSFASAVGGTATTGNVGVLVDDLNPAFFSGADQDSRPGNPNSGYQRVFVVGKRTADVAIDGNRYTRALQVNSRHHYTLTCGAQNFDQEFTTQNLPLGDTHNEGLPVDRNRPGQYAYPTVQWTNRAQPLIDPITGVRSARAQSPLGTASAVQTFQTAIDAASVWTTPSGPLSSGRSATFTGGTCGGGTCPLFLRTDSLSISGGATYTGFYGVGSSLDWVTVTISNASINNGACSGNNCKITACLTVNGTTCTSGSKDITLTTSPTSYTLGTTTPIDLWQGSGPPAIAAPDVSQATGTLNYTNATKVVSWVSGNKFSIKWGAGSRIKVNGTEYAIASVQNELTLTLASAIGSDLSGVAYSANNFGVLIWKKTVIADTVTIGYTTFLYGSTAMDQWMSASDPICSPGTVTVSGVAGYNCMIDRELVWLSVDGSDIHDLGYVGLPDTGGALWSTGQPCGENEASLFDPLDADTWYCLATFHPWDAAPWPQQAIIKAHYEGSHASYTPGSLVPGCNQNGGVQPCIRFTPMQPNAADAVSMAGPAFALNYGSYQAYVWLFAGVSSDGNILILTREIAGADTKGWLFVFALGDRTPAGTDPNSIHIIAAKSSYDYPPCTWCTIHGEPPPEPGWVWMWFNDFSKAGGSYVYGMTLTSALLTTSLSSCPSNPLGVTGVNCTAITVNTEHPTRPLDGTSIGTTAVGDVILIDSEYLRIVAKADANHLTVQRGYISTVAAHAGTALAMYCGAVNTIPTATAIWNYIADPYGQNTNWNTVLVDYENLDGHAANGPGVLVSSVGQWYRIGDTACPKETLSTWGMCYQVRLGATPLQIITANQAGVAIDPPFAGVLGLGNPNNVDSHPGPCTSQWCSDARPFDGGNDNVGITLGTSGAPFTNVTGQLWKLAGGATNLFPKFLNTFAYVGRSPLVDISGPGSSIPTDSSGSYEYCVALAANECRSGSAANDVYVNAPYVSYGYCLYPGIAYQSDDTNAICIGPLGGATGNLSQFGLVQDSTGATQRRLGPGFSRWNQQSVFWNMSITPTGQLGFSQVRWLDSVRDENILTVLPPFPTSDSISRNTFVPVHMDALPTRGSNVVVEFGYAENGSAGSFFCTSRQEACVAASSTVNQALPFYYAQSETYRGVRCGSECTVEIPALSQRVLYYRWKHLDAFGAVVAVSDTRAIVTP
jgi:hypothetical protein